MIIPKYWTEEKKTKTINRSQKDIVKRFKKSKQITISRFGWSDISQEDAHDVAIKRIEEAFEQIEAGKDVIRKEERDGIGNGGSYGI